MIVHTPKTAGPALGITEADYRQSSAGLQESEARLQTLAESTGDILWEVDQDGVFTYCSSNVSLVTGYEAEEMLGRTLFDFMPSEDASRFCILFTELAAEQRPFSLIEHRASYKGGYIGVMECSGKPVFNQQGSLKGYRGVSRDITERKRQQEEENVKRSRRMVRYLLPWGW